MHLSRAIFSAVRKSLRHFGFPVSATISLKMFTSHGNFLRDYLKGIGTLSPYKALKDMRDNFK